MRPDGREALGRLLLEWVAPVARRLGASARLVGEGPTIELGAPPGPSEGLGDLVATELIGEGGALGRLELRSPQGHDEDARLVLGLVEGAVRHWELSRSEEALLEELCQSHEGLNAVYEIGRLAWGLRDAKKTTC